MKPGQIVMTYAVPIEKLHPIGEARLIKLLYTSGNLERWKVSYVNGPTNECEVWIKVVRDLTF
jgi:hypothetical protein